MRSGHLLVWLALGGCACGSGSPAVDAAPTFDATPRQPAFVHLVGRFDDTNRFAWPGSTIVTRFDGPSLTVELDDSGSNQFTVWIDGVEQPVLETTAGINSYVVANGLADAEHQAVISRRTESFFGTSQIRGFPGSTILETLPPYDRFIELIGDSITCGYGVLGDTGACEFDADTESEPDAWGGLTARALNAGHTAIAYSGRGVYRNFGGDTDGTMPVLFERTFADDAASQWTFATTPDVVVVALGTNDFATGDPGQPFVDAYDAFLAQIRGRYPDAHIIVAMSPMLTEPNRTIARGYLEDVVQGAGPRVTFLDIPEQLSADGYGCDFHPNRVTQQKMADVLVPAIRAVTGW